ncbi:MAG TPA: transposase family protein [Candidatus Limnocylindrales bacterium]|nr:transposase family protein [Candidatus Limnocylindrales bacterium]
MSLWAFVILDGKIVDTDRVAATTTGRKGELIDLWYSGKRHDFGGNLQAVIRPDGLPVWISAVEPGSTHDLTAAHTRPRGAVRGRRPGLADP